VIQERDLGLKVNEVKKRCIAKAQPNKTWPGPVDVHDVEYQERIERFENRKVI
jgi:hypothetical protein